MVGAADEATATARFVLHFFRSFGPCLAPGPIGKAHQPFDESLHHGRDGPEVHGRSQHNRVGTFYLLQDALHIVCDGTPAVLRTFLLRARAAVRAKLDVLID
jgi:hypothetical protein